MLQSCKCYAMCDLCYVSVFCVYVCGVDVCFVPTGNSSSASLVAGPGTMELQQPHLSLAVRSGMKHSPPTLAFLLELLCSYQDTYTPTRVCLQQFEKDTKKCL